MESNLTSSSPNDKPTEDAPSTQPSCLSNEPKRELTDQQELQQAFQTLHKKLQNSKRRPENDEKITRITLYDLLILFINLYRGYFDPDVGFEHSDMSFEKFLRYFEKRIPINTGYLEAMLWASNILAEKNKFWHPRRKFFVAYLQDVLPPGIHFDRRYNVTVKGSTKVSKEFPYA